VGAGMKPIADRYRRDEHVSAVARRNASVDDIVLGRY